MKYRHTDLDAFIRIPTVNYGIEDLEHKEIHRTIEQGVKANRIPAEALHEDVEKILGSLTNAVVVLLAKEINADYMRCTIKIARFQGTDKTANFSPKVFTEF